MRPERLIAVVVMLLALAGCATSSPSTLKNDESDAHEAARVHTELGQQYMQQGDLRTAMEKLQKAVQYDDGYAPAHTVLGVLYERIGQPDQAEAQYRRAVALSPKKGDTNNNFGVFLCKRGKTAEALEYFKRAIADPFYETPDVAWSNSATCRLKAHDTEAAKVDYRRALRINPANADALYQMAALLLEQNDAFRARAFIQRFDALGRPSPASLQLGHDIETRLGNGEGAQAYAQRLSSLFPDSEQAQAIDARRNP